MVLTARGGELEQEFAYGIVRQLFEPLLAAATPHERAELLGGFGRPGRPLFEDVKLTTLDEDETDVSFAMLHGLFWLAANLALRRPFVIAVDDLHWADGPSLRWLTHLQRRLEGLPLLVVAATRPPDQSRSEALIKEIAGDPGAAVVRPAALGHDSVGAHRARDLRLRARHGVRSAAACHAAGGNPLFVWALLDTVRARRASRPSPRRGPDPTRSAPEPVTRAVSAAACPRLPSEAAVLAQRGGRCSADGAAAAPPPPRSPVLERDLASHAATTPPLPPSPPPEHRAIRSSSSTRSCARRSTTTCRCPLSGSPPTAARRRSSPTPGADAEQIAGPPPESSIPDGDPFARRRRCKKRRSARSPERIRATLRWRCLRRALDRAAARRGSAARCCARSGLAERRLALPSAVERLAEAADEGPDPVQAARASLEYGRTLFHANRPADAIEVLQRAGVLLGDADPDLAEQIDAELIGSSRWLTDYLSIAEERLSSISEDRLVGGVGTAQLLGVLAVDEAARAGSRERAADLARRALAMPEIAHEGAIGIYLALNALTQAGESVEAYRSYALAVERARRTGDLFTLAGSLGFLGYIRLHHGELLDAEADLREGLELIRPAGNASAVFKWYAGTLANLLLERGEPGEAAAVIESAELERQRPDDMQLFFLILARGQLHLARHEPELALADFGTIGSMGEAGASNNPGWAPWRTYAALALHQLGRDADALALASDELEIAHAWGAAVPVGVSLRVLGQLEGGEAGIAHLEEAAAIHAASPARLDHARSLVELGAALRRANRRADARVKLRDGFELAHAIGATVVAEQAQGGARRDRRPPEDATPPRGRGDRRRASGGSPRWPPRSSATRRSRRRYS